MKIPVLAACLVIGTFAGYRPMDTSSMLKQHFSNDKVVSQTSRDLLQEFKKDLDDLSARMGATSFGRAEEVDASLFRSIECCTPEVARYVPIEATNTTTV